MHAFALLSDDPHALSLTVFIWLPLLKIVGLGFEVALLPAVLSSFMIRLILL